MRDLLSLLLLVFLPLLSPGWTGPWWLQDSRPPDGSYAEIRTFMDLQIHPTMHMTYGFFGEALQYFEEADEPELSYKHQFKNVLYANYLVGNPGLRIMVNGAINKENIRSPEKAREGILAQIRFIEEFAAAHPEDFAVARSPEEVRRLVHGTDKTIIIHSIEGGRALINSQADAYFWAEQGVSFITLIHLVDYHNGGAAIKPGLFTALLNFKGLMKRERKRGLTQRGKQAIRWMANAGIMTDLTHMSDQTRSDAIAFMEAEGIPPIVTHDMFKPVQNHPRGIPADEILKIYAIGGFISLPNSGESLRPVKPAGQYRRMIDSLETCGCFCPGSVDEYKFTYGIVQDHIESHVPDLRPDDLPFEKLPESEKVKYAIGFQTDFNGWLNHSRPRFGKDGCFEAHPDSTYEAIELVGMPHPGLMASQWSWMEKQGVDIEPVRRASERFLQIWEYLLDRKGTF